MPDKRSSETQGLNQIAAEFLEELAGEPAPITPIGKRVPAALDVDRAGDLTATMAKVKA